MKYDDVYVKIKVPGVMVYADGSWRKGDIVDEEDEEPLNNPYNLGYEWELATCLCRAIDGVCEIPYRADYVLSNVVLQLLETWRLPGVKMIEDANRTFYDAAQELDDAYSKHDIWQAGATDEDLKKGYDKCNHRVAK